MPISVLVGTPIDFKCSQSPPSEQDVTDAHALFYNQLQEMFDRHKADCGFPEHELIITDKANGSEDGPLRSPRKKAQ
jgi:2-acylglycerol O-acyltransferase 2